MLTCSSITREYSFLLRSDHSIVVIGDKTLNLSFNLYFAVYNITHNIKLKGKIIKASNGLLSRDHGGQHAKCSGGKTN